MKKGILKILDESLLNAFKQAVGFSPLARLTEKQKEELPVDYFEFYNSVSSVYSSKIEGEEIDYDSYFKHKFLNVPYQADYTKKADDLLKGYEFIQQNELSEKNVLEVHELISQHLLPASQRGRLRNNPMFVLNEDDRIEYVAVEPGRVEAEWLKLFSDVTSLLDAKLSTEEVFYYAAQLHLVFVKIHPFQDSNGRTARLLEKWFLISKLGETANAIELEKNYYKKRKAYYDNIRKIGLEYEQLDYSNSLDFLLMTILSIK